MSRSTRAPVWRGVPLAVLAALVALIGLPWLSTETHADVGGSMSITKTASSNSVTVGNDLTYTIGVANNTIQLGLNTVVTDTLPSGVTFVSASASQGSCSQASGTVTCNLGQVPSGQSATVTIVVTPTTAGSITNTASVQATEMTPAQASVTTTVNPTPSADLAIAKSDSPDPVTLGNNVTYTLNVVNNGPSDATGVTVTDTLPSGVTFVSASASQGSCSQASGTVTCNLGNLAKGASASITIVVTPTAVGTITDTARVTGNEPDSNPANNTDTEDTTVIAPPTGAEPLTPGYWKNHKAQATPLLPLTLGNYTVDSFSKATDVFAGMNCGKSSSQDAVGCLAGHLLASKFNVANGASTCINPTIAQADTFLKSVSYVGPSGTYSLTSTQRSTAIALKDALDKYNNGKGCS